MSNSPLVQHVNLSPNHSGRRTSPISKITIHHTAGVVSAETIGNIFKPVARQASSQYGIGFDGKIGMYVEEHNRSWCSSSAWNDQRAITIEVSNSSVGGNWLVSDYVMERLIELCTDIVRRNPTITELTFTGDRNGSFTSHRMFANTSCPGPYLYSKMPYIVERVKKNLNNNNITPTPSKNSWEERVHESLINRAIPIMSDGEWNSTVTKNQVASWLYTAKVSGYFNDNVPTSPTIRQIKVGDKVKFVDPKAKLMYSGSAKHVQIPEYVKQRTYTVSKVENDDVLLKEITSWVRRKDVTWS